MSDDNTNQGPEGGPTGPQSPEERRKRARKLYADIALGGLLPAAVFGALVLIWVLWPLDNQRDQVGFRGVGMVQFTPAETAERLAELNAVPESQEPYVPAEDDPLMRDLDYYENVQVLGHLTEDNFLRFMNAITEWVSPEQGCAYCHAGADQGNFADDSLYTYHVSRRMIQMTWNINENWQSHVKMTGATCYTCHRGQPVPEYHWYIEPRPEASPMIGDNTMVQNRSDATVGYASLPGDPLTKFLLETDEIRVGNDFPRAPGRPAEGEPTWQDTEWTYGLMFHFSGSLGVNCTYCHNSRAWNQWDQSPPTRVSAWYAIRMMRDINRNYMHNLEVYPPDRLGPTGDAPKANCTTCHQGVAKPLYGVSMLDNWPELRTSGTPDYSAFEDEQSAAADTPVRRAEAEVD